MKVLFVVLILCGLVQVFTAEDYYDRQCGQNLGTLWLDVVAVVDNSVGMTDGGLASISANIASVFSSNTIIGTRADEPKTTRLGLVTYNAEGTINADLNQFQSIDDVYNNVFTDLSHTSNTEVSYLSVGLDTAQSLFTNENYGTARQNYQKVVIVYASAFLGDGEFDPFPVAERLRTSGVTIITVGFVQTGDDSLLRNLEKIASYGYNFTNTDNEGNLIGKIQQALMETNCFCPNDWKQVKDSNSYKYGVCIQPIGMSAVWRAAKMSCSNRWKNAYMANEYSQMKHDFIFETVKNVSGFNDPYVYHLGLSMIKGKWIWDQPSSFPQLELADWRDWADGYPIAASNMMAVINMQNSQNADTQWENIDFLTTAANYVCEVAACDTDNYCSYDGR